jgi:preprotein translocase subunit SecE
LQVRLLSPLPIKQKTEGKKVSEATPTTAEGRNIFERAATFLRQVVAELKKVVWPTKSQLFNYTIVVLVFVVIVALIIAAFDFVFTQLAIFIFG